MMFRHLAVLCLVASTVCAVEHHMIYSSPRTSLDSEAGENYSSVFRHTSGTPRMMRGARLQDATVPEGELGPGEVGGFDMQDSAEESFLETDVFIPTHPAAANAGASPAKAADSAESDDANLPPFVTHAPPHYNSEAVTHEQYHALKREADTLLSHQPHPVNNKEETPEPVHHLRREVEGPPSAAAVQAAAAATPPQPQSHDQVAELKAQLAAKENELAQTQQDATQVVQALKREVDVKNQHLDEVASMAQQQQQVISQQEQLLQQTQPPQGLIPQESLVQMQNPQLESPPPMPMPPTMYQQSMQQAPNQLPMAAQMEQEVEPVHHLRREVGPSSALEVSGEENTEATARTMENDSSMAALVPPQAQVPVMNAAAANQQMQMPPPQQQQQQQQQQSQIQNEESRHQQQESLGVMGGGHHEDVLGDGEVD
eukprot:GFYU01015484.1.p1 GENE.GFYU01015484.1~~GFYU01015484.1.p1  ORF type:complete len:429 (-),score=168.02 GFYU01015484.1:147-1433(-)